MSKDDAMVVDGAKIKCTMGDKSSTLKVTTNSKYKINGKKAATIMDMVPGPNLFPPVATFGTCKPYKAVPPPGCLCTPVPTGPWMKGFTKKKNWWKACHERRCMPDVCTWRRADNV